MRWVKVFQDGGKRPGEKFVRYGWVCGGGGNQPTTMQRTLRQSRIAGIFDNRSKILSCPCDNYVRIFGCRTLLTSVVPLSETEAMMNQNSTHYLIVD